VDNVLGAESRKILRHIADKYKAQGNPDLIGMGALERSSIEQWLQTEAQSFDVPSADMIYSLGFLPPTMPLDGKKDGAGNGAGGRDARQQQQMQQGMMMNPTHVQKLEEMKQLFEKSSKDLGKVLDIYDQRLEEAEYLAGDKFTLADLSHMPNADRLASDPRSARLIQSRTNVSRWWADVSARESWVYVKSLQRPPASEAPF
jgi:glutathione S-transferase